MPWAPSKPWLVTAHVPFPVNAICGITKYTDTTKYKCWPWPNHLTYGESSHRISHRYNALRILTMSLLNHFMEKKWKVWRMMLPLKIHSRNRGVWRDQRSPVLWYLHSQEPLLSAPRNPPSWPYPLSFCYVPEHEAGGKQVPQDSTYAGRLILKDTAWGQSGRVRVGE